MNTRLTTRFGPPPVPAAIDPAWILPVRFIALMRNIHHGGFLLSKSAENAGFPLRGSAYLTCKVEDAMLKLGKRSLLRGQTLTFFFFCNHLQRDTYMPIFKAEQINSFLTSKAI